MRTKSPTSASAVIAALALLGLVAPLTADAAPAASSAAQQGARGFEKGQAAIDRLNGRLPDVANAYGLTSKQLRQMLLNDDTLSVDSNGELAYFDVLAPGEAGSEGSELPTAAPSVTGPEFQLSSLPGAAKTIYLDFDGHVTTGTTWNSQYGVPTITSPPYDTNGNPDAWSTSELQTIAKTWAVVAEDFAPWNINVTTIDPGVEALRWSGAGDTQWGARVVITDDTFANCGCGGHAYIGAFDDSVDEPTFVYNSSFVGVSEASSHEVGHMLNLAHDGTRSVSYYEGHDASGSPGWAPIMGVAYYQPVTQWSQQEYYNANNSGSSANYNNGPDDLAIISSLTNGNGFGLKDDDHGNELTSSTPLNGDTPSTAGIISTRTDVDVFSFSTFDGPVSFAAAPAAIGPNLDIGLTIRNAGGTVVASSNPPDSLNASVTTTLAAGTYSVEIDGVGVGTPGNNPPSGYTDYASLGQYTLTGTIDNTTPPDTTPPAAPTELSAVEDGGAVNLAWIASADTDLAGYTIRRSTQQDSGYVDIATVDATSYTDSSVVGGTTYFYMVVATDFSGNVSTESSSAWVTIPVNLTTFATSETAVYGTVSGSLQNTWAADGVTQTITEVDSGGKPKNRHDRAEHRWSIPSSEGGHTLTVVATANDGGDADTGFTLQWTSNGSTWITLDTYSQGQSASARTYDLGGLIGTIQVRFMDNNRARGQLSHDSISVDLIELEGGGIVAPPPAATETIITSFTVSTPGAGKGLSYARATIQLSDDLGLPVVGAEISVEFSGSIKETVAATTNSNGTATATTSTSARKPNVSTCVFSVLGPILPYGGSTNDC